MTPERRSLREAEGGEEEESAETRRPLAGNSWQARRDIPLGLLSTLVTALQYFLMVSRKMSLRNI